jgi:hypothetical protein
MSKGFFTTIETIWQDKNDKIEHLNDLVSTREKHIEIIANEILRLHNFKCIHEEGEYQRGHRYCDDKCPLVPMCNKLYEMEDEKHMLSLSLLCKRQRVWSK